MSSLICDENDEGPMSKDEGSPNEQMMKQSRSYTWGFGFRHSFVIRPSCFVIFIALIAATSTASAEKRNITEKDLFDFVWIGDPQVSPDGSHAAFVRVTVNEKKEGYNTSIWTDNLESGRPRPDVGSALKAERRQRAAAPSTREEPRQL